MEIAACAFRIPCLLFQFFVQLPHELGLAGLGPQVSIKANPLPLVQFLDYVFLAASVSIGN